MLRHLITLLAVGLMSFGVTARDIKYGGISGLSEDSLGFAVLKLALEKANSDYQVIVDKNVVTPGRVLFMLENGQIDITDGGFSPGAAELFEPVYLPIDMGLSGWRIFLTHKDTYGSLSSVGTIDDLKTFTLGQGQGWYDTDILQHAGFHVVSAPKLSNLFGMVEVKRFDLLPLGASEAYELQRTFGEQYSDLVVDDRIVLVYPFGRFFYLRKSDTELKQIIETGMNKALDDGSLMAVIKSHPFSRDAFEKADLKNRVRLQIETPNLTEGFKSIDPKWWYAP